MKSDRNTMFNKINKFVSKYAYSDKTKHYLLKIDAYASINTKDSINVFNNTEIFQSINQTKISFPYIIEKFIVFGKNNGKKSIEYNAISKIFDMGNQIYDKNLTYEKLIFNADKEQLRFQDNNYFQLRYRYLNLFKNDKTSQQIIKHILKMELDKFILLYLSFVLFIKNFKNVEIFLDEKKFKRFILCGEFNFSDKNISDFLEYISISKEDFKKEYNLLRTFDVDITNNLLSNEVLSKIDRILPKISFYYPLIKENSKYYFTSFTAVFEFLKLERVFSNISENKDINKYYKENILGKKLIEEYVRNQANIFLMNNKTIYSKVYGGEEYKVDKQKFDEPDVILESDKYYIFIECKNSISHLIKSIHSFDQKIKDRIEKDLDKSKKNFERYVKNHTINQNKKIYKFLMYFNATPVSTSSLKFDLFENSDFILTDISSIELLFRIKNQKLDNFIDEYIKQNKYSIYEYITFKKITTNTKDFENTLNNKYGI